MLPIVSMTESVWDVSCRLHESFVQRNRLSLLENLSWLRIKIQQWQRRKAELGPFFSRSFLFVRCRRDKLPTTFFARHLLCLSFGRSVVAPLERMYFYMFFPCAVRNRGERLCVCPTRRSKGDEQDHQKVHTGMGLLFL